MNTLFETGGAGPNAQKDEWLTPPYILEALGPFDVDPCSPVVRPWSTAKIHYTQEDNGLMKDWVGKVWCNPPYGALAKDWLMKCAMHGNAIALTYARTETAMFFNYVWDKADALFFIRGRLQFYDVKGVKGDSAGAPSVLIAYGKENVEILRNCKLKGKFIQLTE